MRTIIIASLAACGSDVALMPEPEIETVYVTNTVYVDAPNSEQEQESACWFSQTDRADEHFTATDLTVHRTSSEWIWVQSGEPARFSFEMMNADCGTARLDTVWIAITPVEDNPAWLEQIANEAETMNLWTYESGVAFHSAGQRGFGPSQTLQYVWYKFENADYWNGSIASGENMMFNFDFTGTLGLQVNDTFEIDIYSMDWYDYASDTYIQDDPALHMSMAVTIRE